MKVKYSYDQVNEEAIPFVLPLRNGEGHDIDADIDMANSTWSRWLMMEDWMLGRREPGGAGAMDDDGDDDYDYDGGGRYRGKNVVGVKREERDIDDL